MGGKNKRNTKNKNTTSNKQTSHNYDPPGQTEEIIEQVIFIRELFEKTKQRLRQSEHRYGYLLSIKWLGIWKTYTGYEALVKNQSPEDSKQFGKKKPSGKINEDLLAKNDNKFVKIPESLLEYQYLNYPIDDDYSNQKQFIIIDQQLWTAFQTNYPDAICIRRPLRKRKSGQPYVDVDMHNFNFLVIGQQTLSTCKNMTEDQYQKILKRNKKDETLQKLFAIKKIRVPSIWQLSQLETFFKKFAPIYSNIYDVSKIQFWKSQNYLSFNQTRQNICSFFRQQDSGILANQLNIQQCNNDLDEIFKNSSLLLIICGDIEILRKQPPESPQGYCEQCIQDKKLQQTCLCGQVFYCSDKCLYDDKAYHSKICSIAFDSSDDEQYQKKSVYVQTQQVISGLVNLGNTCYMNSSLQCLSNLQWFYEYFSSNQYAKLINQEQLKQNKGIFIHKFSKFVKKINEFEIYSPYSLKAEISYFMNTFKGYTQHDANDFIIYLFNTLNDFTSKQGDLAFGKFIVDNLVGKFKSTVTCPDCKIQSVTDDIYLEVSLPIKSKVAEKQIQYIKIIDWKTYEKGTILVSTWKQIYCQLKLSQQCRKFIGTQSSDLKQIIDQSPQQIYKKHKKQTLLFYPSLSSSIQHKFHLAYSRLISGNQMKTIYGFPIIKQLKSSLSLSDIYIEVAEMIGTDQSITDELKYLKIKLQQQIQICRQQFKKEIETIKQKIQNQQTTVTEEIQEQKTIKQQQQSKKLQQQIMKIEQKYNSNVTNFSRDKLKFRLAVCTSRKGKKACVYCGKKCSLCILPFSVFKTIQLYQKLGETKLQIQILLQNKIQITEIYSKTASYNQYTTLEQCLQEFSKPQQLDQQNAWYCEICDMMRLAQKELKISQYPKTLIFQLKRFKELNGKKVKNNQVVWYPDILEIHDQKLKYRLSGVVVHEGSLDGGHYWSVCRKGNQYYNFNDEQVKKVSDGFQKGAYIIIYEQID